MVKGGPLRRKVAEMVDDLSNQYGACFAKQRVLREKIFEKYGQRPGENSIRRIMRQLQDEGLYGRRRVLPGGALERGGTGGVDPRAVRHIQGLGLRGGTTLQWKLSRQVQRAQRRRRAKELRALERRKTRASNDAAIAAAAAAARAASPPPPETKRPHFPPETVDADREARERARVDAMAAIRAALAPPKGPDPPG